MNMNSDINFKYFQCHKTFKETSKKLKLSMFFSIKDKVKIGEF